MYLPGIKASELIQLLQQHITLYGDCECSSGGTDYPSGVKSVKYNKRGDSYTPSNSFTIR